MWNINTMEFFSAIKNKAMSFVEKWIQLEIFILSIVSQFQKDTLSFLFVSRFYVGSQAHVCTYDRNKSENV